MVIRHIYTFTYITYKRWCHICSLGRRTLLHKSVPPIVFGDQASVKMQEMVLIPAGRGKIDFCS